MNVLPPAQTPVLIGHDAALKQVADAYASGRMPHAWLITGAEGIGKATLAYHIAHFVLSNGHHKLGQVDMLQPSSRLIAAESHPDLFVLRRPADEKTGALKDNIPVVETRNIAPFLHMTASHGTWRVALIDEAHALNRFGQNAILKVIEEPPPHSLILLTATTAGALVPTIRSRCRVLPLQALDGKALATVLARSEVDVAQDEMGRLVRLSAGSAGFALSIARTKSLPLFDELEGMLKDGKSMTLPRIHALADKVGRKSEAESFTLLSQFLTETLRQSVKTMALGGDNDFLPGQPLDRSMRLWDNVSELMTQAVEASLDRKLAFVNALSEIRRAMV